MTEDIAPSFLPRSILVPHEMAGMDNSMADALGAKTTSLIDPDDGEDEQHVLKPTPRLATTNRNLADHNHEIKVEPLASGQSVNPDFLSGPGANDISAFEAATKETVSVTSAYPRDPNSQTEIPLVSMYTSYA